MTDTITAKQIHEDFAKAEERLYVEAIGLVTRPRLTTDKKAERLKSIGFSQAKAVVDFEKLKAKQSFANSLVNAIDYFRINYPANKFITEEEVKRLCQKYNLLLGDVSNYISEVPEKNLATIEAFRLKREDFYIPDESIFDGAFGIVRPSRRRDENYFINDKIRQQYLHYMGVDPFALDFLDEKVTHKKPPFKICAPVTDFNTQGLSRKEGYMLVDDPIVLQPVKKYGHVGYLVVDAWGPEAKDEALLNPVNN